MHCIVFYIIFLGSFLGPFAPGNSHLSAVFPYSPGLQEGIRQSVYNQFFSSTIR